MHIYTGAGDRGETSTLSRQKVSKNDAAIHFEGTADELNSHLGLIKALLSGSEFIEGIQRSLMKLMAHVSDPSNEQYYFSDDDVGALEREIDRLSGNLPPLSQMVVPGKNATEAHIHIARSVARRTERLFTAVNAEYPLCRNAGAYLNRLSDYLFVLARTELR
jgi:ATP:cob(I)alamin adenosyltransferase